MTIVGAGTNPFTHSPWYGVSTGPGIAGFVIGSAVLLCGLVTIRVRTRPRLGGNLVWVAVWLACIAIALYFFGQETEYDQQSTPGVLGVIDLAPVVGLFSVAVLVFGLTFLIERLMGKGGSR
jgi:hypothetical protein